MKPERVLGVIFAMVKSSFICIGCILWFSWGNGNGRAAFRADFGTAVCRYRQSCRGERASDPPGAYFSHAGKVGKRALRGKAPKDPKFLEQGRGGGYIRNDIGSGITYEPW